MTRKISSYLKVLLGLSIAGWLNALYTLWHRQKLYIEGLTAPSFCNLGQQFNCDAVALSRFSQVGGMPTSALGLFFYSVLTVLILRSYFLHQDKKESALRASSVPLFLLCAFALIPTLALALTSFFILHTLCLMCLITYLINIALFIFTLRLRDAFRAPWSELRLSLRAFSSSFWILIAVLAVVQLFSPQIIDGILSGGSRLDSETTELYVQRHFSAPLRSLRTEGRPSKGPLNAKLLIVEYSDFQCPYCAREAMTTPQLLKQYESQVRIIFKNYPLDPSCNPEMKNSGHAYACLAAKSGFCVYKKQGDAAFFNYKDELFLHQKDITAPFIKATAVRLGLSETELDTCVNDYATQASLLEDIQEGSANGVQGTPTLFLNQKLFEGASVPKIFSRVLEIYFQSPR